MPVPESPKKSATSPGFAHVGRAVHREDAAFGRQHEVQDREDALLYLPRVGRAADEDDLALEVYPDEGLGLRAVLLGVGKEAGTEMTVQSGSKASISSLEGRLKSCRAKRACQACSVTTWTLRR